jgi:hypothetical protein
MPKVEVISSPANPLLKDIRRAIVRGSTTEDGYCVAESFHLLEEALRSDCEVGIVLAADGVRQTVENHVKRLSRVRARRHRKAYWRWSAHRSGNWKTCSGGRA